MKKGPTFLEKPGLFGNLEFIRELFGTEAG